MTWKVSDAKFVTAETQAAEAEAALLKRYTASIQQYLDFVARSRDYDSIQSAITYRGDSNPRFASEAEALFAWRSAVWTYATEELQKVTTGTREQPDVDAFLSELPAFAWPD